MTATDPTSASGTLLDLFTASLEDIREALKAGHCNSVQLTTAYIARIQEVNPQLNAVLEINSVGPFLLCEFRS